MFQNKEALLGYCIDDVSVLRQACCAFRNVFLKLVKMDPFRQALTISSICNKVFQTMFLKPETRYYPEGGYLLGDRQSIEAIQWLAYIGQTRDDVIHAGNGREVQLPRVPNVNLMATLRRHKRSLRIWVTGMDAHACQIGTSPLAVQINIAEQV
jgi:hypothetical protein